MFAFCLCYHMCLIKSCALLCSEWFQGFLNSFTSIDDVGHLEVKGSQMHLHFLCLILFLCCVSAIGVNNSFSRPGNEIIRLTYTEDTWDLGNWVLGRAVTNVNCYKMWTRKLIIIYSLNHYQPLKVFFLWARKYTCQTEGKEKRIRNVIWCIWVNELRDYVEVRVCLALVYIATNKLLCSL